MIRFILISLSLVFVISSPAFSQKQVRKELKNGNKEYVREKYTEAEIAYRKALEVNARSTDAAYNLGNSLYKQSKFQEAMQQYEAALSQEKDKNLAAADWHNVGNIFMSNKDYSKSIEAYKKSLRLNPNDDETRYNLALAQKLLENQQQQDNQDQNKDKDKQEQNKDEQQKQEQQQDKQEQQQQQQQQNPNEMQKENAEQILDAMMQNERDTQEKVKAEQVRQQKQRKTEKNW
ncbi:MAG: tetratricopeptide repeat protein [Dysgonamonadaceae bacterium]|jgi:tetratricopeptide (TPR) repeat protein|nr:tetratricopeptide repeat protein [Dysgonamonadaceae bacterium]